VRLRIWVALFLLGISEFGWGQTNGSSTSISKEATASEPSRNYYSVIGAMPGQESSVRSQIQHMQPSVLPLRIVFMPHWKYLDSARIFKLQVPTGYSSVMFTHLPSRTVFIDNDRYAGEDWLAYWMAHELGHLACNNNKEEDAERVAREYRMRLKPPTDATLLPQAGLAEAHDTPFRDNIEEWPFELGNSFLIVVEGHLGRLNGLKFILDTGASRSVVDRSVAEKFALRRRPGKIFNFDKYIPAQLAEFPEVQFGPVKVKGATLMIADLFKSSRLAEHVDAIIGLDLLCASRGLLIDYEARRVFFRSNLSDNPTPGQCPPSLTATIMIQGHPVRLVVDTGMEGILLYENKIRKRFPQLRLEEEVKGVQVGYLRVKQAKLPGVWLGSSELAPTVSLLKCPANELGDIDGYLGPRALNARQVEFNFEAKTLVWSK
jgi:hypothetical protein